MVQEWWWDVSPAWTRAAPSWDGGAGIDLVQLAVGKNVYTLRRTGASFFLSFFFPPTFQLQIYKGIIQMLCHCRTAHAALQPTLATLKGAVFSGALQELPVVGSLPVWGQLVVCCGPPLQPQSSVVSEEWWRISGNICVDLFTSLCVYLYRNNFVREKSAVLPACQVCLAGRWVCKRVLLALKECYTVTQTELQASDKGCLNSLQTFSKVGAVKSCTISKKKDKAGTLDVTVQFLPAAGCWGLRCGIALAFIWMSICYVCIDEIFSVSRSMPVEMAENSSQKHTGVQSRRLSWIVEFVEMWPSLEIRTEKPTPSGS